MINISPITALLASSAGSAALAVPSLSTDGVDVSAWNVGSAQIVKFDAATVYIKSTGTSTLTGPAKLYGYRNGLWWFIGQLNGGSDITLTSTAGYAQRIDEVAIFSRLAVACASVTGSMTYTYSFEPIAIRND